MAKLDDIITSALSGESHNEQTDSYGGFKWYFKQTFNVTQDTVNFKWIIKSELYLKMELLNPVLDIRMTFNDVWLRIGNGRKILGSFTCDLINYTDYVKLGEHIVETECPNIGRGGFVLACGINTNYYLSTYQLVYLTLPAFSGSLIKINGGWKYAMPWIKVNGSWKRALTYQKVNGSWKKYNDTWRNLP